MIRRIIAIGLVAAGAAWMSQSFATPPIEADDPRQIAIGQPLYARHCAECHGANLEGQPNWQTPRVNGRLPAPPQDATGHSWRHPDEELFGIIKHGMGPYAPAGYQSDMPAFEGTLADEQIAAVLAFIESRWPADIREQQAQINKAWKERAQTPAPRTAAPPPDTVVAVIDGAKITRADVIASAAALPAQYQGQMDQIFPALIDRLVDLTLLAAEARKRNLQDDPEAKAEIVRRTDDVVRELLIRRYLKEKLTDETIKARYGKFVKDLPPQTEVRASHILVASEDEAKDVIRQLQGGTDFAQLARSKSKDPSAAKNGGDLGYFTADRMVKEFSAAAFALEKGQFSQAPVKSQFGWHVILVVDRREKAAPTLDQARSQVEKMLSNELVSALIDDLHKGAKIEKFNPDGTPLKEEPAPQPGTTQPDSGTTQQQ